MNHAPSPDEILNALGGKTFAFTQTAKPPPHSEFDDYVSDNKPKSGHNGQSGPPVWTEDCNWLEDKIPARPWISPGYFLRGSITVLWGPSSVSKSTLSVAYAAALALNKPFGQMQPTGPMRIMVYNVEDDAEEQKRRFSAVLRGFNATPADLSGLVMRVGPNRVGTLLARDENRNLVATEAMQQIEDLITRFKPDVLFLDPLVELHIEEENDNTALRSIMARFRAMAKKHDLSLVIVHHARKGTNSTNAGDPDTLRGASSIIGAARAVLTVTAMGEEDAKALGLQVSDRQHFFRVDRGKSNYSAIGRGEWFQRLSVVLANGDAVAAPEPWQPPEDVATLEQRLAIKAEIEAGSPLGPWSAKLSGDERSVRHLFSKHGIMTKPGQEQLLRELAADGYAVSQFKADNRQVKQGIRAPNGLPENANWIIDKKS
jgi:hypothetical protein